MGLFCSTPYEVTEHLQLNEVYPDVQNEIAFSIKAAFKSENLWISGRFFDCSRKFAVLRCFDFASHIFTAAYIPPKVVSCLRNSFRKTKPCERFVSKPFFFHLGFLG